MGGPLWPVDGDGLLSARRRRRRRLWPTLGILAILATVCAWLAVTGSGGGDPRPAAAGTASQPVASRDSEAERERIAQRLQRAVRDAAALGGEVEAAVMLRGWSRPVIAASPPEAVSRSMRMWSMSKVVTMVSLLRANGWGESRGKALGPELEAALEGAIERSENCPQRRIVIELQRLAGSPAAARKALASVLAAAGASGEIGTEMALPEAACVAYLEGQGEVADPLGSALLLGTSTWRIEDAVRFAHALAAGEFGAALGGKVLALMRVPKGLSREVGAGELTAPLDWGAGQALTGLDPAYKAGWGGTQQGAFFAGQLAVVDFDRAPGTALAVAFHPSVQPGFDDPGLTAAPRAIAAVMAAVRSAAPPATPALRR